MAEHDKEIGDLAQYVFGLDPSTTGLPTTESDAPLPTQETKGKDSSARTGPPEANPAPQTLALLPTSDLAPPKPVAANEMQSEALLDVSAGFETKQTMTAAELAAMIEADLANHPDCPQMGFHVTVYGTTSWRAMLTIKPAAGPVRNPQKWRDLTEELADRLRRRYDLAWR